MKEIKELKDFLDEFEDVNLDLSRVKKEAKDIYLIPEKIEKIISQSREEPVSAGILLGNIVKKFFVPTPNILELINKQTSQKIIVNDKTAWLFICGRDVFNEGIIKIENKNARMVLVLNEKKEILGVAKNFKNQFKNIYDIGIFVRTKR